MAGSKEAKEELPWNVDGELVLTAEFWVTGRGEEEEEEEGEEDWAAPTERCGAGKLLAGPWTKSQKSSGSSEKPLWGAEGGGPAQAWAARPEVAEGVVGGEVVEEGVGKEAGAPTGPWKSVNSSVSSHKAGGCEWVVTEGWDGDDSAKMKK